MIIIIIIVGLRRGHDGQCHGCLDPRRPPGPGRWPRLLSLLLLLSMYLLLLLIVIILGLFIIVIIIGLIAIIFVIKGLAGYLEGADERLQALLAEADLYKLYTYKLTIMLLIIVMMIIVRVLITTNLMIILSL